MMSQKRAEMGVGTLIVFIAMLLVAAVAAGVLIQTAGSLQEQSLSTGQQAKSQISTNARVLEVSGSDGRNGNLTDFCEIIKLSPGSDPIKLSQIIFTFNTMDTTTTLKYRGTDGIENNSNTDGYNTFETDVFSDMEVYDSEFITYGALGSGFTDAIWDDLEVDLDDDGTNETIGLCTAAGFCAAEYADLYWIINMSSDEDVYLRMRNDAGTDINITGNQDPFNFTNLMITGEAGTYGYMTAWRTLGNGNTAVNGLDTNLYIEVFEQPDTVDSDVDDDGLDDNLATNGTHMLLLLSNGTTSAIDLGVDVRNPAPLTISLTRIPFTDEAGEKLGYLTIDADSAGRDYVNSTVTFEPENLGQGYFVATYEIEGTNHVPGNLQRGDVINMCFEANGAIDEDEHVRLNFIPKIGTPTLTQFVTPDVISTERIYLYP